MGGGRVGGWEDRWGRVGGRVGEGGWGRVGGWVGEGVRVGGGGCEGGGHVYVKRRGCM